MIQISIVAPGAGTGGPVPAVAVRHFFTPAPAATVLATWNDTKKSAAIVHTATGKGQVL